MRHPASCPLCFGANALPSCAQHAVHERLFAPSFAAVRAPRILENDQNVEFGAFWDEKTRDHFLTKMRWR